MFYTNGNHILVSNQTSKEVIDFLLSICDEVLPRPNLEIWQGFRIQQSILSSAIDILKLKFHLIKMDD